MSSGRILIADDEPSVRDSVGYALTQEGFEVTSAEDGDQATEKLGDGIPFDLLILDIMMPGPSGLDICRDVRSRSAVPIIVLTAKDAEVDKVVGLEVGADDYVVKPFSARELMARIRAVLRRARASAAPSPEESIEVGDVRLDSARHEVTQGGHPVELTRKEFEVLRLLMGNAGTVVSRDRLIEEVWDMNWFGPTKTLDVHVSALRKKLGDDPAAPRYVHTVRGVGFRFAAPSELTEEGAA